MLFAFRIHTIYRNSFLLLSISPFLEMLNRAIIRAMCKEHRTFCLRRDITAIMIFRSCIFIAWIVVELHEMIWYIVLQNLNKEESAIFNHLDSTFQSSKNTLEMSELLYLVRDFRIYLVIISIQLMQKITLWDVVHGLIE